MEAGVVKQNIRQAMLGSKQGRRASSSRIKFHKSTTLDVHTVSSPQHWPHDLMPAVGTTGLQI